MIKLYGVYYYQIKIIMIFCHFFIQKWIFKCEIIKKILKKYNKKLK